MKQHYFFLKLAFLLTLFLGQVVKGFSQVTYYYDRTSWENALAALPTNNANFTGVPSSVDLCTNGPVTAGSHTFSAQSGCGGGQSLQILNNKVFFSGTTGGNPNIKVSIPSSAGVGFNWTTSAPSPNGQHNSLYFSANLPSGNVSKLLNQTSTSGFFGIITTCGTFNQYILSSGMTNFQQFYMSNFSCSTTPFPVTPPTLPTLQSNVNNSCAGDSVMLSVASGSLNDASYWRWYAGGCGSTSGGVIVGIGSSIYVNPLVTTTYYVRGEGSCVTPGSCSSITINVIPKWYLDADNDGYYIGSPICQPNSPGAGYVTTVTGANDCDDNNAAIKPGIPEVLGNNIDDNCNGLIDELNYCKPTYYAYCYYNLNNVSIGSINNSPSPCSPNGYADFTNLQTTVYIGTTENVSVTGLGIVCCFIDFNRDGDFNDAGETVFNSGQYISGTKSFTITIPSTTTAGPTRFRVVTHYLEDPCNSPYGNIHDYTLNVQCPTYMYQDADSDGYGNPSTAVAGICPIPNGYSANNLDCDDNNASVNPSVVEIPANGIDDNCNGQLDELVYCKFIPTYYACYTPTTKVAIGSINNITSCENDGYGNYTAKATVVTQGATAQITIIQNNGVAAYIDYNQDGDFNDIDEKVLSYYYNGLNATNTITIPTSAATGATRLRVIGDYGINTNTCSTNNGDIEDYTIIILPPGGSTDTTNVSTCTSYTWAANNQVYTQSGVYVGPMVSGVQKFLNLTITAPTFDTVVVASCVSYTWAVNNQTYTNNGIYSVTSGCATHVLKLTLNPLPVVTASNVVACPNSAVALNGSPAGGTWSVANPYTGPQTTFTYTYTDANGCTATSAPASINFYTMLPPTGITVTDPGTSAQISWTAATAEVNTYMIRYRVVGASTWTCVNVSGLQATLNGLTTCSNYELQMQATCSGGSASSWSNVKNFTTISMPTSTINTAVSGTTCGVSWTAVPGTATYGIRYRRTNPIGSWISTTSSTTSKTLSGLPRNACYEVQVQSFCSGSSSGSVWSTSKAFCTASAAPVKPGFSSNYETDIQIYPNPVSDNLYLDMPGSLESKTVKLLDMSGRVIMTMNLQGSEEDVQHVQMNVRNMVNGLYLVQIYQQDELLKTEKVWIQP